MKKVSTPQSKSKKFCNPKICKLCRKKAGSNISISTLSLYLVALNLLLDDWHPSTIQGFSLSYTVNLNFSQSKIFFLSTFTSTKRSSSSLFTEFTFSYLEFSPKIIIFSFIPIHKNQNNNKLENMHWNRSDTIAIPHVTTRSELNCNWFDSWSTPKQTMNNPICG